MCTNKNKTPTSRRILFSGALKMYAAPHTPLRLITPEILFFIACAGPRGSLQTGGRGGTITTRTTYRRSTGESRYWKQREARMCPFVRWLVSLSRGAYWKTKPFLVLMPSITSLKSLQLLTGATFASGNIQSVHRIVHGRQAEHRSRLERWCLASLWKYSGRVMMLECIIVTTCRRPSD